MITSYKNFRYGTRFNKDVQKREEPEVFIYDLFLDDERETEVIYKGNKIYEFGDTRIACNDLKFTICKTYEDAVETIKKFGPPRFISLDHDLGEEKTGYDFLKWLVEQDINGNISLNETKIVAHTANVAGRTNIEEYWKNYWRVRK